MNIDLTLHEVTTCLVPLIALLANAISHIIFFRLTGGRSLMTSGIKALLAGLCLLLITDLWLANKAQPDLNSLPQILLVHFPIYFALSYCYYNFAQLGQTSLRVNLLRILLTRPDGIPVASLIKEHGDQQAIPLRVKRLVTTGDLIHKEGVLTVGRSRLVRTGQILFGLKRFLLRKNFDFKAISKSSIGSSIYFQTEHSAQNNILN